MMSDRRLRLSRGKAILLALVVVFAITLPTLGIYVIDAVRTKISAGVNKPDIIIDQILLVEYPDPMHIKLRDGRIFRLAHLIGPNPGTPEYSLAMDNVWKPLGFGANKMTGLRITGKSPQGETLVELWAFHHRVLVCGSDTWLERWNRRIPRWKNETWFLADGGYYRREPGVVDGDLEN